MNELNAPDFRASYGNQDFSGAFSYTVAPTTYPVVNPAQPAGYGAIRPGFSDITGENPDHRKRIEDWQDRVNVIVEGGKKLLDAYGEIRGKKDPSRKVPTTGLPVAQAGAPTAPSAPDAGTITTAQTAFIAILGVLLLIGIMKG